jgi:hypothetical protein
VAFPYLDLFLGLFAVYLVYSALVRLDARYPIGAALLLLVVAAVADAANAVDLANTLAEYVFCLLAGGVLLLLVEHVRSPAASSAPAGGSGEGPTTEGAPTEPTDQGDLSSDQSLHGLKEQLVPPVDASGGDDDYHE